MIYQFKDGRVTWHDLEGGREIVKPVAIPIDDSLSFGERIIFAMLFDWFDRSPDQKGSEPSENRAINETHARALTRATAKMFPNKLGRGETGFFRIGIDELRDAVLLAFGRAAECSWNTPQVEYVGGQRRDTLRIH